MLKDTIKRMKVRGRKALAMAGKKVPNRPLNAWEGEKYWGKKTKPAAKKTKPKRDKYDGKKYYA